MSRLGSAHGSAETIGGNRPWTYQSIIPHSRNYGAIGAIAPFKKSV
jgi:hypothetical protein